MTRGRNRSYPQAELGEVSNELARLVRRYQELTAGPGAISRLEGATIALRSLAEGGPRRWHASTVRVVHGSHVHDVGALTATT